MMEFDSLATVAHRIEDMFFIIREGTMSVVSEDDRPALFDVVFQSIDFFRGEVEKVEADEPLSKDIDTFLSNINTLIAKIKGIFKRRYQHDLLSADGVTLNLADKTAVIDGKPVELPSKEFDLLALLIENQGKVLKKSYLFGTVWGSDSDSELQTLHVHINRLRQKLGDNPKNAKRLLTVWGVGYKFV